MRWNKPIKVMLVPDSTYWVTGTMANEIASKVPGIEATVCSANVLNELLQTCNGHFPLPLDVVHFLTPHIATALFPKFAARTACVATINHVENSLSMEPADYVDSIMAMCRQWYDYLIEKGIQKERLTIVHYGVDTDIFRPPDQTERNKLRQRYGIPDDAFVIGFSAKRSSDSCGRKGINILEQLIAESSVKNPSIWWVIRGPGWQSLVNEQSELGARITHLPFLLEKKDVAETYRLMDAYIVTSRIEGGPVPLFEAMSSGLSCISTKVGLAPELINNGDNGFLVDFDDVEEFSEIISSLEKNSALRERIGIQARKTILNNLKWEQTLSNVPVLYQKAITAFNQRMDSIAPTKPDIFPNINSQWTESKLKNWVNKRELLVLIGLLNSEGEFHTATKLANSALLKNMFDKEIWLLYARFSSASKFLNLIMRVKRKVKMAITKQSA
jgi:glycosyltransferase involved in cell wall biosynthesis